MIIGFMLFLTSALVGYFLIASFAGKYEGDKLEKSLRFLIGNYYVHIHHWIYSLIILIILYSLNLYHPVVYGIFVGFIMQGLTYRDRFVIIYHKKNFRRIYSKWKMS